MNPHIIGIVGRTYDSSGAFTGSKGAGKNEVARIASEAAWEIQLEAHTRALADPAKEACQRIFGFTADQVYGDRKDIVDPRWGFAPRAAIRMVAESAKALHRDVWALHLIKWSKRYSSYPGTVVFVPDVRFQNEARVIREAGGRIWAVERHDVERPADLHPSERESVDIAADVVIPNVGTLEDLELGVRLALSLEPWVSAGSGDASPSPERSASPSPSRGGTPGA